MVITEDEQWFDDSQDIMRELTDVIFGLSQNDVPVDQADLADSGDVEQTGELEFLIRYDAPHAGPIEFGSRPHTPPSTPIIAWVRRNRKRLGVSGEKEIKAFAWGIIKTIERDGGKAHPYLRPHVDNAPKILEDIIRRRNL